MYVEDVSNFLSAVPYFSFATLTTHLNKIKENVLTKSEQVFFPKCTYAYFMKIVYLYATKLCTFWRLVRIDWKIKMVGWITNTFTALR